MILIIYGEFLKSGITFGLQLLNPVSQSAEVMGGIAGPWYEYLLEFPHIFSWPLSIFFLVSFFIVLKKWNKKSTFFLLIYFALFFLAFSILTNKQDRFFIPLIPFVSILSFQALDYLKLKSKTVISAGILVLIFIFNLSYGLPIIFAKADSFDEVRWAGEILKQRIGTNESIICMSVPMMKFYSKANVVPIPAEESSFTEKIISNNAAYLVLTPYDNPPDYIIQKYQTYQFLVPIDAYMKGEGATAIIFWINKTNI